MISEFRKTIPERRFFVPRPDRFFFPWWTRGGWRDGKLDVEFHFTSDERPPRGGKEGKLSGRMQYSGRPRRQRMSSARETGYPNEIQYGNAEIISRGAPYLTYSACPETWVARTAAGMRLAAHGLHRTALWNRFNGEDSLWKPWYPMDGDTTLLLPPPVLPLYGGNSDGTRGHGCLGLRPANRYFISVCMVSLRIWFQDRYCVTKWIDNFEHIFRVYITIC